jgi:hypothetical protein
MKAGHKTSEKTAKNPFFHVNSGPQKLKLREALYCAHKGEEYGG